MATETIEQTASAAGGGMAVNFGRIEQVSGGLQVGQITNYRVVGESHFYELDVERLAAEPAEDPPRAEELAGLLAESRLLILAGELEDKAGCARRIAYLHSRRLSDAGTAVSIRERYRGKDPERIETAFHESKTTILALPEISQSLIAGYGPAELRRLLAQHDAYAIVTTDGSRAQWDVAEGSPEAPLWQEVSWETYYGCERLRRYLENLFFGSDLTIPVGMLREEAGGEWRIGGVALARVVEVLRSPERILAFVQAIAAGEVTEPEGIKAKLAELGGDAAALRRWYHQLSDRDQLLAIGLVLLDGLPDDLLFAGLEILVEIAWRETDPLLPHFDYRDISRFAAYFKQTPVEGGFVRVECGSRQRRAELLQVAWNVHRRRILATLPALTEMVRAASVPAAGYEASAESAAVAPSAARLAAERALGRTQSGALQIRQAVVDSLSLIGLMSVEVVEPFLLDLAADPAEEVQILATRALAVWREAGRGTEFFALLDRWWVAAGDVGKADSAIGRAASLSSDPWAAVRAAVALAVGFAAQYDRENALEPTLQRLLDVLIDDPHPRVRGALWRHALPLTVAWHFSSLEPFLRRRVLASEVFVEAVARGAAEACALRPYDCLPIVDRWWGEGRAASNAHGTPGEILLAVVAETYGYIRPSSEHLEMSSPVLLGNLRAILDEETHPMVRRHALAGVENQTRDEPELAVQLLPTLLQRLMLADRPQVAALLVRSYVDQRQRLPGGDSKLELEGRSYAVWIDGARPLTGIEATLHSWLAARSRPVAQQIALDAFAAFAATPLEREERRLLASRAAVSRGWNAGATDRTAPPVYALNLFGHLAVVLATRGREEIRPLLWPLMAEVLVKHRRDRELAAAIARQAKRLAKLRKIGRAKGGEREPATAGPSPAGAEEALGTGRADDLLERCGGVRNAYSRALAGYLKRALLLYKARWAVGLVAIVLLVGLGRLYRWADRAVEEPLGLLAERLVPRPDVLEDWMAPLPPGRSAMRGILFPYLVDAKRKLLPYDPDLPVSYTLGDLTAPLPPGWWGIVARSRIPKPEVVPPPVEPPKREILIWKPTKPSKR